MRFERTVAVLASLVLAVAGAAMVAATPDWQFKLLVLSPLLTGIGAAGLAAARRRSAQRAWTIVIEQVVILSAVAWGALGLFLIVPAIITGGLAIAFIGVARAGREIVRPASTVVATGALWTAVFGCVCSHGGVP